MEEKMAFPIANLGENTPLIFRSIKSCAIHAYEIESNAWTMFL